MSRYLFFIAWMNDVDCNNCNELTEENSSVHEIYAENDKRALDIAYAWAFENDFTNSDTLSRLDCCDDEDTIICHGVDE